MATKEEEIQKIVPGEDDENVGGEPPKKKERRRKSKEERAADRRVIFWFLIAITIITMVFYIWPLMSRGSWSGMGKIFESKRQEIKVNQEVIKEMEKPGFKLYTEVKF